MTEVMAECTTARLYVDAIEPNEKVYRMWPGWASNFALGVTFDRNKIELDDTPEPE